MIDTRQAIAASLQSATGAVWSVRDLAPVPGVFRAIPISAGDRRLHPVADQAAVLRAGRNEAIRLGFDAVAISGGLTIASPEPEAEEIEEPAEAPAIEPAPLTGEFRQDTDGVVRYFTAEEVAAEDAATVAAYLAGAQHVADRRAAVGTMVVLAGEDRPSCRHCTYFVGHTSWCPDRLAERTGHPAGAAGRWSTEAL